MTEISPAGFHLRNTWDSRLTSLSGAAALFLLAAGALGLTIHGLRLAWVAIAAQSITWELAGVLVVTTLTGAATVAAAGAAGRLTGRAFARLSVVHGELPTGARDTVRSFQL